MLQTESPSDRDRDLYGKMGVSDRSVEEIIASDWKRNYSTTSKVSLDQINGILQQHVADGNPVYRLQNTLYIVTPSNGGYTEVKFHTLTADPREAYLTNMVMLLLWLYKTKGTEIAYSYVVNKTLYRMLKRIFGAYLDIEDARDDPNADAPYLVTLDLLSFVTKLQAEQKSNGG